MNVLKWNCMLWISIESVKNAYSPTPPDNTDLTEVLQKIWEVDKLKVK